MRSRGIVVRSNLFGVMFCSRGINGWNEYSVFDTSTRTITYRGTLNACKKAWNRHYATQFQFVEYNHHTDLMQ